MGFGKLFEAVVKAVVILPCAAVKDVVTMGGTLDDEGSAVVKTLEEIKEDIDEIGD